MPPRSALKSKPKQWVPRLGGDIAMKITCLICGKSFDFLPPHLSRTHGVSANEYRAEHQIPAGQPLCSESYSRVHAEKIRRMQATGALTYEHLQDATDAARTAGRGARTADDLEQQSARAKTIQRNQLSPGARRADGRDADRARETQRARRARK